MHPESKALELRQMSDPTPQNTTQTTQSTTAHAKKSPTLLEKITMIKDAWSTLVDPEISYAGMKLADYTAAVKPYIDAQAAVDQGKVSASSERIRLDRRWVVARWAARAAWVKTDAEPR